MRVLVCGGREFGKVGVGYTLPGDLVDPREELAQAERRFVFKTLDRELKSELPTLTMCQGGATGGDQCGYEWAIDNSVPCATYPADWSRFGKAAGSNDFKPELVIAFPGGAGTAHMVRIAKKAGVEVREYAPTCVTCVTGNEDVF
jgi:hypothetical protein